jgi:hypothetical protein
MALALRRTLTGSSHFAQKRNDARAIITAGAEWSSLAMVAVQDDNYAQAAPAFRNCIELVVHAETV